MGHRNAVRGHMVSDAQAAARLRAIITATIDGAEELVFQLEQADRQASPDAVAAAARLAEKFRELLPRLETMTGRRPFMLSDEDRGAVVSSTFPPRPGEPPRG